jgi:oxygen-independent coproporphyrinogen-3 oxidase
MGLRLREGIDLARYEAISGRRLDPGRLKDLVGHALVETTAEARLRATPAGFAVLDALIADLAA